MTDEEVAAMFAQLEPKLHSIAKAIFPVTLTSRMPCKSAFTGYGLIAIRWYMRNALGLGSCAL